MATLGVGLLKLLVTLIQVSSPETPRLYGTESLKTKNFGLNLGEKMGDLKKRIFRTARELGWISPPKYSVLG